MGIREKKLTLQQKMFENGDAFKETATSLPTQD